MDYCPACGRASPYPDGVCCYSKRLKRLREKEELNSAERYRAKQAAEPVPDVNYTSGGLTIRAPRGAGGGIRVIRKSHEMGG